MISEFEIFLNLNKFFAVICMYLYAMYVKIYNQVVYSIVGFFA